MAQNSSFHLFNPGEAYTELGKRVLEDYSQLKYHTRLLHTFYFVEPFCSWVQEQKNGDTLWMLENSNWPAVILTVGRLIEAKIGSPLRPAYTLNALLNLYASHSLSDTSTLQSELDSLRIDPDVQRITHLRHIKSAHSGIESKPKHELKNQGLDETITRGTAIHAFIAIAKTSKNILIAGSQQKALPIFGFGSDPEVRAKQIACRLFLSSRQYTSFTWSNITGSTQPAPIFDDPTPVR